MNKITKPHSMQQQEKKRTKRKPCKKVYRYPKKFYFLIDDDLFVHTTQNKKVFLQKRKFKKYLMHLMKHGYISPKTLSVLMKPHSCTEDCTVFIAAKIKLRKKDIISRNFELTQ